MSAHIKRRPLRFFLREQVQGDTQGTTKDRKGVPPVAVVSLVEAEDGTVSRGIAIRSLSENFRRREGGKRADRRAREALNTKEKRYPIGVASGKTGEVADSVMLFMQTWQDRFKEQPPLYKAHFSPALNAYEQKLIERARTVDLRVAIPPIKL